MKEKFWTTEMMLDYIIRSGIKTSWRIVEDKSLEIKHGRIVALLKAFGLYVEEKQEIFNRDYDKLSGGYAFDINDFYAGNFIRKRSKKEVSALLKELTDDKVIKPSQKHWQKGVHAILREVFKRLVNCRIALHQNINRFPRQRVDELLILRHSLTVMEQQAKIIDLTLLKIIGYKKPIPESVLIEKYDCPEDEPGLLTGSRSLQEILAEL